MVRIELIFIQMTIMVVEVQCLLSRLIFELFMTDIDVHSHTMIESMCIRTTTRQGSGAVIRKPRTLITDTQGESPSHHSIPAPYISVYQQTIQNIHVV